MIAAAWTGAEYILAQSIFGQNVYTLMTVNRILHICIVSPLPGGACSNANCAIRSSKMDARYSKARATSALNSFLQRVQSIATDFSYRQCFSYMRLLKPPLPPSWDRIKIDLSSLKFALNFSNFQWIKIASQAQFRFFKLSDSHLENLKTKAKQTEK